MYKSYGLQFFFFFLQNLFRTILLAEKFTLTLHNSLELEKINQNFYIFQKIGYFGRHYRL